MSTELEPIPKITPEHESAHFDESEVSDVLKKRFGEASTDSIELERLELVGRIKERDPLDIAHNAKRTLASIERLYVERDTFGKSGLLKALVEARRLRKLHNKANVFEKSFNKTLFSDIEHSAGDLGDTIELKSPALLAKELGMSTQEKAKNSGAFDIVIGNTDYVFANTGALKSMAGRSMNQYKVTSNDGYVVPVDIANTHPSSKMFSDADYGVLQLKIYADNVYSIPDFKKVFALYSAALFDSPNEALGFYQTYKHVMSEARRWDLDDDEGGTNYNRWSINGPSSSNRDTELGALYADKDGKANDKSHDIALLMRELLERYNIYPPMEPEFQFKDSVQAKRTA